MSHKIRELIVAAGLSEQYRCIACDALLEAYGRKTDEKWSCPKCAVPGATVAEVHDQRSVQ